jgi:uncharacterized membrane protein
MFNRLSGALAGLVVGIILLQFGFWQALFLLACMGIGWWVAAAFLGETNVRELMARYLRRGRRRW